MHKIVYIIMNLLYHACFEEVTIMNKQPFYHRSEGETMISAAEARILTIDSIEKAVDLTRKHVETRIIESAKLGLCTIILNADTYAYYNHIAVSKLCNELRDSGYVVELFEKTTYGCIITW